MAWGKAGCESDHGRRGCHAAIPARTAAETQHVIRMEFDGAGKNSRVAGLDELPGKVNYLVGSDDDRWQTTLPTFAPAKVRGSRPVPRTGNILAEGKCQLRRGTFLRPL